MIAIAWSGEQPEERVLRMMRRRAAGAMLIVLLWVSTALLQAAEPLESPPTRPVQPFPKVGRFEVLRGDFHIHTTHSDGKASSRERVLEAWEYGYDTIAITDHRTAQAYEEARPLADALGMVLIRGWETGLAGKEHMVVLGAADTCQPRDAHAWAEEPGQDRVFYQDQLNAIARAGGVVIYAHPHVGLREPVLWGIERGIIRGMEVKNGVVGKGWHTIESHGTWCYPNAFEWSLEHNLGVFANSDLHAARKDRPPVTTLVLVRKRTVAGVLEAIRNGRTVAWFDGMLWGPPRLLGDLVRGLVVVQGSSDPDDRLRLRLQNRGPVAMKAAVRTAPEVETIADIPPYREVLLECPAPAGTVTIRWLNAWVSPRENLSTRCELRHGTIRPVRGDRRP